MTEVYCKSDCQFSQNQERKCTLKEIGLVQSEKFNPKLICSQYVPTQVSQQRFNVVDMDKAMMAGVERAMRGKLG